MRAPVRLTPRRARFRRAPAPATIRRSLIVDLVMADIPFDVRQIDHLVLRVRDIDAMRAFYRDVLGCREERRQDEIGLLQLRAGASLIDLVSIDGKLGRMGGGAPSAEG